MKRIYVISILAVALLFTSGCLPTPLPHPTRAAPSFTPKPASIFTPTPKPITPFTPTPAPPGITWTSIGPSGGGMITALAVSADGTIFAGCDVGGVYRSTDDGGTWQIINEGLRNYRVYSIAVDPSTPSTVYLGTLGGIYKSIDGGDHWEWKRHGFPPVEQWSWSAPILSLAIAPSDPSIIYAGGGGADTLNNTVYQRDGRIWKSTDGGETWSLINTGIDPEAIVLGLAVDPENSQIVYATSTDRGFYESTDGGASWQMKSAGLPHDNMRYVVIDPSDPDTLYLTVHSPPGQSPWSGGVYKSTDGGEHWEAKSNGLRQHVGRPGDLDRITSNYDHLLIDPTNPQVLYVGDISYTAKQGVYKSTDGGDHWELVTRSDNMQRGWLSWTGVSVASFAMDPNDSSRLYFGESTIFRTDDGGESWAQIYTDETPPGSGRWQGRGLEVTELDEIVVDPRDSNTVYFGFFDIGFIKTEDGGRTFTRHVAGLQYPGNIFKIVLDPENPDVIYASSGRWEWNAGDVVMSLDGGENWTVIGSPNSGLPDARVNDLVLDLTSPFESRTLYATSYGNGVYKSEDGGMSWTAMNVGLGSNDTGNDNLFVSSLVMDPGDPNVLYAGVDMGSEWLREVTPDQYGGVYKSENGGLSWQKVGADMMNYVLALAIDPSDSQIIYAGAVEHYDPINKIIFEGGVFRSTNGGQNWVQVLSDPTIEALAIDPDNPHIIYAGTNDYSYHDESTGHGVFRSMDGGETWKPVNDGLSHLGIYALDIDPSNPSILYVGTSGNGVFKGMVER